MTEKKLVIRTEHFLKYELNTFIDCAGRKREEVKPANLKNYVFLPSNYPESLIIYDRVTYCIAKAISEVENLPQKPYQSILIYYYLDKLYVYEVQKKIGYSNSRFGVFKRRAIDEFTHYFNFYVEKEGLSSIIELVN